MSSLRVRFDRWIFDSFSVTPEGLGLYRIAFGLFGLLFIAPGHAAYARFTFLASFPDIFFLPPPGPMQLLSGFPPAAFFDGVHLLLNLCLVAVLFGYRTRWASVLTSVLFLVGYGFSYSLGKINHNMLFVLLPLVMSFSNWGAAFSFDARAGRTSREVASWPIVLTALLTGFAMFTAGFPKILGGWLDPSTHAAQGRLVREFFIHGRRDLLAPLFVTVESPMLWELFDLMTVGFEVGFLFAVIHPLSTRLFAAAAVGFHTGVMLIMNIAFLPNLIVYAAFLPWTRVARFLPRRSSTRAPSTLRVQRRTVHAILLPGTTAFFYFVGSPLLWLNGSVSLTSDLTVIDLAAIGIAFGVVLASAAAMLRRRWGKGRPIASRAA